MLKDVVRTSDSSLTIQGLHFSWRISNSIRLGVLLPPKRISRDCILCETVEQVGSLPKTKC